MTSANVPITLDQLLKLVGHLDDSPGEDTARVRFREFLQNEVPEVGQIRDYVEECLRTAGEQYSKALQDLVNHLGSLLGFDVEFGRYQGVQGATGFDGLWTSPSPLSVVVEVKTTEVYAVKTSTLVGYVDALISQQKISTWEQALGLYVIGRPDPELRQLENSIVAERRTDQLRIVSLESLLALAELMAEYDVTHDDVLSVLRPSGPSIDQLVDLMSRLTVQPVGELEHAEEELSSGRDDIGEVEFWLTPVKSDERETAEEVVQNLVGKEGIYAFGERTPGRKHIKAGDLICSYATGTGIIAHGRVASSPAYEEHAKVRDPKRYPWVFKLVDAVLYVDKPVAVDAELRARLKAFEGRKVARGWAWFVQATHKVDPQDFGLLTRTSSQTGH